MKLTYNWYVCSFNKRFGKIIYNNSYFFTNLVSIIHVRSKHKNPLSYKLAYPPLFMCIILSPFNLYFTSLIVVSYPIIIHLFIHHKTNF